MPLHCPLSANQRGAGRKTRPEKVRLSALIGGVINGLMPCSMTMSMAVKTTTAPFVAEGALLTLAFGVGIFAFNALMMQRLIG